MFFIYFFIQSEPTKDIDILAVKMSIMNSEKLNIQTTWNMEIPNEMMLGLKDNVPTVVSEPMRKTYYQLTSMGRILERSFEKARRQGAVMFKRAADNFASVDLSKIMTVTDSAILIVKQYQKNIEILLDAVITFLRETTFQIPGYENRLSGLEVYQKCSAFVADVSEEALQKIPEYFASMFTEIVDYIRIIEFTLPGSNYVVSGKEILDDLIVAMNRMQGHLIATVNKLGAIQLEDIIKMFKEFINFAIDKSEKLIQTLKSQNVISTWLNDVYIDAMNTGFLVDISTQVEKTINIVMHYLYAVQDKFLDVFAAMSIEQFNVDIQSWIDTLVKRLNAFQNNAIKFLKEKSKNVEPFVRVSDRQMEVEIPFPFSAKLN